MKSGSIRIAGAEVLCPATGLTGIRDLFVVDGNLALEAPAAAPDRTLSATGLLAVPGFVEIHAHLREPGFTESETIETGLAAALAGGYTAVFAMANTRPPNDRPEVTRLMLERAEGSPVRLHPVGAATVGLGGTEIADYGALKAAGAAAISDDGIPVRDDEVMRASMIAAAAVDLPLFHHSTHHPRPGGGVLNDGPAARRFGVPGLPAAEEDALIRRDVRLARETGLPVHICHLSTAGGVEAVREARAEGVPVTAEAAPHHLVLTDRDVRGTNEKMNPPLRSEADRRAVVSALADGTIEAVATDHAPHAPERKALDLADAPFGVIGMEAAFAAVYTALVPPGEIGLEDLVRRFTEGPARIGRIPGGALRAGRPAELNLIDRETPFTFGERHLAGKSRNCPFLGRSLLGRVVATVAGGRLFVHAPERFRDSCL